MGSSTRPSPRCWTPIVTRRESWAIAYHERWEIEITLDEIEVHQHFHDGPIRSKKPVGVLQELYGLLIAHWAVRFLMHQAAIKADLDPERLSFTHALRVIGEAVRDFQTAAPEMLPLVYARMLEDRVASFACASCPLQCPGGETKDEQL